MSFLQNVVAFFMGGFYKCRDFYIRFVCSGFIIYLLTLLFLSEKRWLGGTSNFSLLGVNGVNLGESFAWWYSKYMTGECIFQKFSPIMVGYTNLTENSTNILEIKPSTVWGEFGRSYSFRSIQKDYSVIPIFPYVGSELRHRDILCEVNTAYRK